MNATETTVFTLDNGLRVVHEYRPTTAMVAVATQYDVGARDEHGDLTGLAHLFEHLMFGGSVNIPDFDRHIDDAGGINNAFTSNDFTVFYDIVPAVNAETVFWLESDRMLSLAFNPKSLEVQRHVVIEEFKQVCLNKPYGDLSHHLRRMLFGDHPYSWPVIGKETSHIERVTEDDVRKFFFSHYAPNNAILAVCGNITAERTRQSVEKYYADIPRRELAGRNWPEPAFPAEPRRECVKANVPYAMVLKAFPMGGYRSTDFIAGDMLSDILASGQASRLKQELVLQGNGLFVDADASVAGSDEPGYFLIQGRLSDTSMEAIDKAEHLLSQQLEALSNDGPSDEEVERTLNRLESRTTFEELHFLNSALRMLRQDYYGETIEQLLARYRAMTPTLLRDHSRRMFNPQHCATLIYTPEE